MTSSSRHKLAESGASARLSGWRKILPLRVSFPEGHRRVRLHWPEAVAMLFGICLTSYGVLTATAYFFVKYNRGFDAVSYADLTLPHRWHIYRLKSGEFQIAEGRGLLAAGDPRAALASYRAGLAKIPDHRAGRLELAQLLTAAARPDLAREVLEHGLTWLENDAVYLRAYFGFLLQQQLDDDVRSQGTDLLARRTLSPESRAVVSLAIASAHYFRGQYDLAEDRIRAGQISQTIEARLLSAQLEWERGYPALAFQYIRTLLQDAPNYDPALAQLGQWLRSTHQFAEFRRVCLLRSLAQPDNPAPQTELLYALHHAADHAGIEREVAHALSASVLDQQATTALATFAADTGNISLAERIRSECQRRKLSWTFPTWFAAEAMIAAKDYRAAIALLSSLPSPTLSSDSRQRALVNSLLAVAHFGLGDSAAAHLRLEDFIAHAELRADNLLMIARRLVTAGAVVPARSLLLRAATLDPANQAALTELVSLEVDLAEAISLPGHLEQLSRMRRPSPNVLQRAHRFLSSDRFLFDPARENALHAAEAVLSSARHAPQI